MSADIEWIEKFIREEYHATVKEIIREIKLRREVDFNDMMMKFYGITKTSDKKYLLILEYAEGADLGLSKRIKSTGQISFDTVPYDAPEGFNTTGGNLQDVNRENKQIEKLKKSDIYSTGILLWELSSGKRPFVDREYNISLAREITQGLRESIVEGTPKEYSNLYATCWDGDPDKRPTIQEVVIILKSMISLQQTQQMIKQLKLNHGLFLDEYRIEPSKQAVLSENGILNISLYRGQPLVYTYINDPGSRTNLLSFNLDYSNELEALQPSDICINFPVAEITYNADLLESFSNFMEGDEALYETYGQLFARKLLVGGTLFIDDFKSITSKQQIDSFKSLLTWVYNSVKYNNENPFNNLSSLKFFPKLRTSCGEKLHAPEDLINWMNKLYQDNMLDVISYTNLILISELRLGKSSSIDSFQEKQSGIINFKEKLSLEDWVSESIYVNLERWVKEFHLLQGIIINEYLSLEISKKTAVSFVNVPSVYLDDIFHLDMINPTTNLGNILILNNIFSTKNAKDISTFPFIKRLVKDDSLNDRSYAYFLVRRERYKILLSPFDIKPSEEFKLAIEAALESMRPFEFLQNVFDEYGHLFPLTIVLGKSLKNILPRSSKKIYLESPPSPTFESLKLHLDNLNISYLLTQKGNIVEKNGLSNWIQNKDKDFEIIEFENIISLYDILEVEQRKEIDIVLNKQDEVKIIMTGIVDLEDLDNNNIEHYKRINVQPSLESENYKVFGSIISNNDLRLEDFSVTFGLYDLNGFFATIKTLNNTSVNITECYILWMIVGNPSKLSIFSPKNRDIKVNYIKESIALQPDISCYSIKTCQLSEGHTIFLNYHCLTANYEPIDIKLVEWSNDYIDFQIVESNNSDSNKSNNNTDIETATIIVDVHVCILSSDYKSLIVDNEEKECYLNLIGNILTEKIYSNNIFINELLSLYKDYSEKDELIRNHLVLKNKNENEIFNYLLSYKNKKQNIILLADFYKHGIGTEKDEIKAFELTNADVIEEIKVVKKDISSHEDNLDDVNISDAAVNDVNNNPIEKNDNEILRHQNYLDDNVINLYDAVENDVVISDNAVKILNDLNDINIQRTSSINSENSDLNDDRSIILETRLLDTRSKKYHDILKLLADENCLAYNYALSETIRLIEDLIRPNERIEDRHVIDFALKAANRLSDYKWTYYNDSTIVQLELFLNAMSSVLCILSQSVDMIHSDTRVSLYKSVSKSWKVYRKSNYINANIMFRLREIRTCLRIIEDDQSNLENFVSTGSKVIETIYNVVNSEYLSALSSVTNVLNFEYSAGIWYDDWKEMHEIYFKLHQQSLENNLQLDSIKKFIRKLIKLSTKEFERVKRKNTKYRNLEYKVLKTGGELLGYSLPDNIDTLLIGYLHLIQQILEEFFPQIKGYIKKITPLCNDIINTHVKKQLTFKAVEVLYVIKENTQKVEIKNEIESNFDNWSNFPVASTSMTTPSRPSSSYTVYSTCTTPDTPTSIPKYRKLGFSKIKKTNPQKDPQQQRKQIIEGVTKLFEERRKIYKNINETKIEYSKLLEDRAINEHSIVSKLKEILEKKRKENESKDIIEYIKSLEDKIIDEQTLSKLKEVLGGESERKDEIGLILSNLKEISEGIRDGSKIRLILMKLKEILERNIEEESIFEEILSIEEVPTIEAEEAPNTDNTYEVEENIDDAESEEIKDVDLYLDYCDI
ncbi:unnamed protein product [Rhizophagus irregularis]|nr:unnamed protein product [Rhizophagus irregularis]